MVRLARRLIPPSDPAVKGIWQSDYFVKQMVQRNNWIRYTETALDR